MINYNYYEIEYALKKEREKIIKENLEFINSNLIALFSKGEYNSNGQRHGLWVWELNSKKHFLMNYVDGLIEGEELFLNS